MKIQIAQLPARQPQTNSDRLSLVQITPARRQNQQSGKKMRDVGSNGWGYADDRYRCCIAMSPSLHRNMNMISVTMFMHRNVH
ncbi:hypothetical protein WH50_14145 [Pokkaliibacter plantistimulans]|uniref:Uncharacterized protein n=1 Tax=Pokkaliibacter plantistimulans TaxID=1635171 RepID=A0ABX5LWD8_9GAMM|nr:hypothetical protein WH50_14145 [Pokkaliibacter plantistimulans]